MVSAPSYDPDAAARLVMDAAAIHAGHVADDDGYCRGCLRQWARLVRHPCPQDSWAVAVIGQYTPTVVSDASSGR